MNRRFEELLPEYLLGHLGEEDRAYLEELARESPEVARELAAYQEAFAMRAHALEPVRPSDAGRSRFLNDLTTVERFRPFLDTLSRLVDLPKDAVRTLLGKIDDVSAWEPTPIPNFTVIHFDGGPRLADVDAGFVRLARGAPAPRHRHGGPETTLVLEGVLWEEGRRYFPGSVIEQAAGSTHELSAGPERDLVFVVTYKGVEVV